MFVQSGSGKVYAVLAQTEEYQLGVEPTIAQVSTSICLSIRCRYVATKTPHFNPMLVPKPVLVGGISRSQNTLRGSVMLNTGFTIDKLGKGFGDICAFKLFEAAPGFLIEDHNDKFGKALHAFDRRDDFCEDFAKLVNAQLPMYWPPKDLSTCPDLISGFDMALFLETQQSDPSSPFKVVATSAVPKQSGDNNVEKVSFGNHALDGDDPDGQVASGKVHVTGSIPDTADD